MGQYVQVDKPHMLRIVSSDKELKHQPESQAEKTCLQIWKNGVQEREHTALALPRPRPYSHELGLVHIGKTGGGQLQSLISLNRIPYDHELHRCPVTRALLGSYADMLVTMRDPIDRVISAFYWAKEGHMADVQYAYERESQRNYSILYEQESRTNISMLYTCFQTVNSFAEQLDDTSNCGELGRSWIFGIVDRFRTLLSMGTCFHLGGVLSILEDRPLAIIHTESLEADFAAWATSRHYPIKTTHTDADQHATHEDKFVSKLGRFKLRKYLEHEYWAQQQLEAIVRSQRANRAL